jgi:acetyl coenzyme A synthetase (ADP forming)-like protein
MLDKFFKPQSVAVIGASREPGKLGYDIIHNLVECGYTQQHVVYPINPKADEILDIKAYPSVLDIPGPVDLGVIVIPAKYVADALRECGKKDIHEVVIITAGFREAGPEGLAREKEVIEIAREHNIQLIGPNCLGIIDTFTPLNASFAAGTPPQGPVNFTSQSGALGTAVLDSAMAGRLGFSKFVSLGNKAGLNEIDLFRDWADDPKCNVIMAYIEGVPDGQQFMTASREIGKRKPIVALKSGVTQSGSRAVSSHTGSLAGSEQAYGAAFKQAGIVRANSMEEMFDFSLAFGYQPLLPGDRIAVITNAGGPGILATDAIERYGLKLARLEDETKRVLTEFLPAAASAANPVDVLGDAMADRYEFALDKISKDPNVDGMLIILTPQSMTEIKGTAEAIANLADKIDRPILTSFMGEARSNEGIDVLTKRGIPNYPFPERAAAAFKAMSIYREAKALPLPKIEKFEVDKKAVQAVFDKARAEDRVTIGDFEARDILTAYGFSIPHAELADTADKAVEIANQVGYPVVLKIASPDILHKTDVGGVKVGVSNAQEVRDAFDLIVYRAQRYVPNARIWGCVVQQMVPQGLEVLVGMNRDPQFGPLVTFALGGIYVEILKDATFRIAPFSREEAGQMLGELRARALLDGVRGKPPVDKESIIDTLLRIGQLVTDFPEIVELDINPLIVFEQGQGAVPIDMRLVLK